MANGRPGDHPLTDILNHKLEVYGEEADDLIRKIGRLSSKRELDDWWNEKIAWTDDLDMVLREARSRYDEMLKRARSNGWEVEE